jgi:hypothetical protein
MSALRSPHARERTSNSSAVLARLARIGLGTFAVLASGCHKPEVTDTKAQTPEGPVAASPGATGAPVDHLAPGELVEGSRQVFGVALPRVMNVRQSFVDVVYASGPATLDALVPYFRSRLEGGSVRRWPSVATFEHASVRGKPGVDVFVRLATVPEGASVEIRDATPHPGPSLPDQAARWRQVGLTPEGRLIDPSHLD